jgi:hypothetical protein
MAGYAICLTNSRTEKLSACFFALVRYKREEEDGSQKGRGIGLLMAR